MGFNPKDPSSSDLPPEMPEDERTLDFERRMAEGQKALDRSAAMRALTARPSVNGAAPTAAQRFHALKRPPTRPPPPISPVRGGHSVPVRPPRPPSTLPEKWRLINEAPLYKWVAASLGVNPDLVEYERDVRRHVLDGSERENFRDRLEIAASHVGPDGLECVAYGEPATNEVRREVFIAWAQSIGWKLPAAFGSAPVLGSEGNRRIGTLYRLVIGMAVRRFDYDPEDKTNNRGIAKAISEDLQYSGVLVSEETVKAALEDALKALPTKDRKQLAPTEKAVKRRKQ